MRPRSRACAAERSNALPKEVHTACGAEVVPREARFARPERELIEGRAGLVELEHRLWAEAMCRNDHETP